MKKMISASVMMLVFLVGCSDRKPDIVPDTDLAYRDSVARVITLRNGTMVVAVTPRRRSTGAYTASASLPSKTATAVANNELLGYRQSPASRVLVLPSGTIVFVLFPDGGLRERIPEEENLKAILETQGIQ